MFSSYISQFLYKHCVSTQVSTHNIRTFSRCLVLFFENVKTKFMIGAIFQGRSDYRKQTKKINFWHYEKRTAQLTVSVYFTKVETGHTEFSVSFEYVSLCFMYENVGCWDLWISVCLDQRLELTRNRPAKCVYLFSQVYLFDSGRKSTYNREAKHPNDCFV